SQRYSRVDQQGQGTDILSGISTTVTALYSDIYGIQPKWNRMGLVPNLTPELNDTKFTYTLRDTVYDITLKMNDYQLRTRDFLVRSVLSFGVGNTGLNLRFYPENEEKVVLIQHNNRVAFNNLRVTQWKEGYYQWVSKGKHIEKFELQGLTPGAIYQLHTAQ